MTLVCPGCGGEVEPSARFCDHCGHAVAEGERAAPSGIRKVVTILFADLAGSTSLQEQLDAETTRRVMDTVHALLRDAVERNDGHVVKFMGDGVMAVFGVPVLREDDAVRAVRAGSDMHAALSDLIAALRRDHGAEVGLRVGVNTGEVVVTADNDDVVGDPVNVAARLEVAADVGGVLIGPETLRLVRDVFQLESVEPIALKGKRDTVAAARLVAGSFQPLATVMPFTGRESDVAALVGAFEHVETDSTARVVTVLGSPGLGKSRLAEELAVALGARARVMEARFLPAGGSSFGPVADALRSADVWNLVGLGDDLGRVAATVDALCGGGAPGSTEQVFWAIRRLLEALASQRPVIVFLDDLHWAEPTMLDLVEHLAEWLRGPVLLIALARPELRDRRPSLLEAGGPSSAVIVLGALDDGACRRLACGLLDADDLPELVINRAMEASEGNPLFLRELLRLLVDDGVLVRDGGRWSATVDIDAIELPATVHAALAARIEQLQPDERQVLQAASVIGRHFARGALADLVPAATAARLDEHLATLHRRALVDPEGTWWVDERLFRFHHVFIRDAAYRRVLKEVRADQHVRYADWVTTKVVGATAEHDEVLGWHLERAHGYRTELGGPVDQAVVERAVHHLSAAGRRALESDDLANAASLLGRALALAPDDADLLRDRCEALVSSGDTRAATIVVARLAAAAHDDGARAIADVFAAQLEGMRSPETGRAVAERAGAAAQVLARHGDDLGVAKAEAVRAVALAGLGRIAACEAALDRALAAARRAGDRRRANVVLAFAPAAALWGPSPVARASGRCLDVVRVLRITSWAPHVEAHALRAQAVLEAMRDRPGAGRRMIDTARETFTNLGHKLGLLETAATAGQVELLAGDPAAAEAHLRTAIAGFDALDARVASARAAALLARALLQLDRVDEADAVADPSRAGDDLKAAIGLLGVRAEVLARHGELTVAEELARRAVALAKPTDALVDHADARLALSRVLAAAGRKDEAIVELTRAHDLYAAKGSVVGMRNTEPDRSVVPAVGVEEVGGPAAAEMPSTSARRPVRANRATAMWERWVAAMRAGDGDSAVSMYSHELPRVDHQLETSLSHGDHVDSTRAMLRYGGVEVDYEFIATLGDRHALHRDVFRFTSETEDAGQVAVAMMTVSRVGPDGLVTHFDTFGRDDLAAATACLVERWAEDELDGPARTRALGSAGTWTAHEATNAGDSEAFGAWYAADALVVDHRPTGAGEIRGREAILTWRRGLAALGDSVHIRLADVVGISADAALVRYENTTTQDGGDVRVESLAVVHYDDDGRFARQDLFSPDALEEARACFDAAEPVGRHSSRRVRRNLAADSVDRSVAAVSSGDIGRAAAIRAPGYAIENHELRTLIAPDAERQLEMISGAGIVAELLATLGERHALHRVCVDWDRGTGGGRAELEMLLVSCVADDGRFTREDRFAADALGPALGCLVERWGDDEADAVESERILRSLSFWAMGESIAAGDWEAFGSPFAADVVIVDHRLSPMVHGRDALVTSMRELADAADEVRGRFTDVLAMTGDAALVAWELSGVRDGGVFQMPMLDAAHFGPHGIDYGDILPAGETDAAWSCFDAIERRQRRCVTPNRVTEMFERWIRAFRAGDIESMRAMRAAEAAAGYVSEHHSLKTLLAAHDQHAGDVALIGRSKVSVEPLATLGERHALHRVRVVEEDDLAGELAYDILMVDRTTSDGVVVRQDRFEGEQLVAAMACLVERWAQDELHGSEQRRALGSLIVWSVADAISRADAAGIAATLAADVVVIDHRPIGVGEMHGREAAVEWLRQHKGSADVISTTISDVLALGRNATLWRWDITGSSHGRPFEVPCLIVHRFGPTGPLDRMEVFSDDDIDAAWDRFDEMDGGVEVDAEVDGGSQTTSRPPQSSHRRVGPNIASHVLERTLRLVAAGDVDAAMALCAPDYVLDHELRATFDFEAHREMLTAIAGAQIEGELLATLGERHALHRVWIDWDAGNRGGRAQIEMFNVTRVNTAGLRTRQDRFEADQLAAAMSCLVERWAADELDGPERVRAMQSRVTWTIAGMINRRDLTGGPTVFADDVVLVDHRPTGAGEVRGRAGLLAWIAAMFDIAELLHTNIGDVLALTPDATLWRWELTGEAGGGAFQVPSYLAQRWGPDGRVDRSEFFSDDQLQDAWACFERLDAGTELAPAEEQSEGQGFSDLAGEPETRIQPRPPTRR